MSVFTDAELAYLRGGRKLARVATVGRTAPPTSPRWACGRSTRSRG